MKIRFDKCGLTAREHSAEENKPWCLRSNVSLENLVLTQKKGACAPFSYIREKA